MLWVVHVLIQGGIGNAVFPARLSRHRARSGGRQPSNVYHGRATRALANYVENLVPFVALDLGFMATHHPARLGPDGLDSSRARLYPALSGIGVPWLRTTAWAVSLVGLLMMLVRLSASEP